MPEQGFRIETVVAFVAHDGDDDEGIMGFLQPDGTWMPMIAADEERIRRLRPIAEDQAKATGQQVKLVRFSQREDLETIDPGAVLRN